MKDLSKKKGNLSILAAYQFFAIEEKYKGVMYKDISKKINIKYSINVPVTTIKCWFWKGGILTPMYRDYADIMIDMEIEETRDLIKGNLKSAVKGLAMSISGRGNMAQVSACKEFLDRGLGKVKDEVDMKHSGSIAIGVVDILKAKNELEKQNEQDAKNSKSM